LCAVYYHAFHGNYHKARDMFLISHVQEFIENVDIPTKILYNRALVVLGLSAFQMGFIQQAYESLSVICSGRTKELLAQRISSYSDNMSEDDRKAERRRLIPYHMHIDTDMLDCVHLTCAMLIELPSALSSTQRGSYKTYRKQLKLYNAKLFMGPPETVRDHVMAASNAVAEGQWQKAQSLLLGLDKWKLLPGGPAIYDKIKVMLSSKLQALALRIYILQTSAHYDSISIDHLCELFEIDDKKTVIQLISQMIHKKEISGAWEQGNAFLMLYNVQPSPLQKTARRVAEQLVQLTEGNEKLVHPLSGGVIGSSSTFDGQQGHGGYHGNQYAGRSGGTQNKSNWKGKSAGIGKGYAGGKKTTGYRDKKQNAWGSKKKETKSN